MLPSAKYSSSSIHSPSMPLCSTSSGIHYYDKSENKMVEYTDAKDTPESLLAGTKIQKTLSNGWKENLRDCAIWYINQRAARTATAME